MSADPAPGPDRRVDVLLATAWRFFLDREPHLQLRQHLPVLHLPSPSEEESAIRAAFGRRLLDSLAELDVVALDPAARLSVKVLRHVAQDQLDAHEHFWRKLAATPYTLAQTVGLPAQQVLSTFAFERAADVDRYLVLVHDYAAAVRSVRQKSVGQAARGVRVPQPALPGVLAAIAALRAGAPALLGVDESRLTRLPRSAAGRLHDEVADLLRGQVDAAYAELLAVFDDSYAALAPEQVGASGFAGEGYYRHCVRRETTLDLSAEQLHTIGLEQCRMLADEMAQVRASIGFSGSEAEFHTQLRHEPRLYAATPAEVEALYLGCIERLGAKLSDYFRVLPHAPYGVERLDRALEPGMTYGYYEMPTPGRPMGRYRFNASDLANRSLLTAAALIYHELVPGHHFHLARQSENETLPMVRREAVYFNAFAEGWAEYASGLALEMGLYDDPYDRYGRLVHERFTAQRLVVDTGMNLFGWSLERGQAFMRANSLESDTQIRTETLRYSTDLPGQALAYRAGFLAFADYRARAEGATGVHFDVRDFHELILGAGALPLYLLADEVDSWSAARS